MLQALRANPAIVIIAGGLIVLISMGLRQSFGIFMHPLTEALGIGRESFGLAIAVQNLLLGLPLAGYLADKFSAQRVIIVGTIVYAASMLLMPLVQNTPALLLTLGVMTGLAQSATTFVVVLGAVGRVVKPEKRASSFGLVAAIGSFGMFLVVPIANHWLISGGWAWAFEMLAWTTLLILFAVIFLPKNDTQTTGDSLGFFPLMQQAMSHRGYKLLIVGFFVCGFHVAFIATHLPAYVMDMGLDSTTASNALALIGLFNIIGSFLFGWLGDRFRKKHVLAWLYSLRTLVIGSFLLFPVTEFTALLFGAMIGLIWLATVPLTSGMVGHIFGVRYLGTLYGMVFLGHQLGSFTGAWLGGLVFDATGSYNMVWYGAVILSIFAALLHRFIDDRPKAIT